MILQRELEKIREEGYRGTYAGARLCQDIVLGAIASGNLSKNVTIKGGVVMRSLSGNTRRATQDIDFDFIKYSISDESLVAFVNRLDGFEGLKIEIDGDIETLNQQDYKGKRIYLKFTDETGMYLRTKLDIGVHFGCKHKGRYFKSCYQDIRKQALHRGLEQLMKELDTTPDGRGFGTNSSVPERSDIKPLRIVKHALNQKQNEI